MSAVTFQQEGKIGIININHPATLNSLCQEVRSGFVEMFRFAEASDVRAVIIKGNQRSFSSGGNLHEIGDLKDPVAGAEYINEASQVIRMVHDSPKVTIAMVEGYAFGAGLSLATACDLIYAGDKAKFASSFVNVGLVPDCGVSFLLTRLVGLQKAKEMAFTGKVVDAAEALQMGLVSQVFASHRLFDETRSIARKISMGPPKTIGMTKAILESALKMGLDATLTMESNAQGVCMFGDEHTEGRTAFFEKRSPIY
ncbi:enoyl-CoA hydratase/carnithine racemase [Desulfosporosinus orientis DSM 765]|uniref:Enoyl-CoA hydratase/carnithine racemase n=1 Tax=Desulfosporosinus orientis (strain ATCC 19365 / DSM 765 / NCIMB 8382 / VKM B-1628 / Singapore I) TaxID=768706 RepID=G7WGS8_DESOD|nr:enoyl-CoA hydratase-related protein [Desulfosporosinus orientis]AET68514.1 enoyl-CoA hydratase/carnithine racemase [Desulfosporosinus orientis DSM 765]